MTERRRQDGQRLERGGRRQDDPPLTTEECGIWMGVEPEWILDAINEGKWSTTQGCLVQLHAEFLPGRSAASKGRFRIYIDDFITFLRAIGWSRLPARR